MNNFALKFTAFLFFIFYSFTSCATTERNLKIGVITDMHYLSEKLMDKGEAIHAYSRSSGRSVTDMPAILDMVVEDLSNSGLDVLLIPGDLTKDGEKQSLVEVFEKLDILRKQGVKIFTVPGNHDVNVPQSLGYKGNTTYKVENVDKQTFEKILADEQDIYRRDSASLSYVANLDENTWLIGIDGCLYEEYTTTSITAGRIKPETEKWILRMLDEAKMQNKLVIGMMHHGLVEHIMYQDMMFRQYLIEDWKRLANLFADNGMKVIFTGHFHANDITMFKSAKGNKIYDIETGALASYPFPYRIITLDDAGMSISTKNITSTPQNPDLVEENKKQLRAIAEQQAIGKINSFGFGISQELASNIAKIAGTIMLLHVAGDEVVNEELEVQLKELSSMLGQQASEDDRLELDFFPADNNVRIDFE